MKKSLKVKAILGLLRTKVGNPKQDGQHTYNVTLMCICITIVAMGKQ